MKCQEFRADERVVIKVAQLATAIGHSSLKCTDLIGQLVGTIPLSLYCEIAQPDLLCAFKYHANKSEIFISELDAHLFVRILLQ